MNEIHVSIPHVLAFRLALGRLSLLHTIIQHQISSSCGHHGIFVSTLTGCVFDITRPQGTRHLRASEFVGWQR